MQHSLLKPWIFPNNLKISKVIESYEEPKPIFLLINKDAQATGPSYIYDQTRNKLVSVPNLAGAVFMFREGKDGRVYIGTINDLFEVDLSTGEYKAILSNMPYVLSMYQDEQERFWLGTLMGLAIWDSYNK
jgi:ligand-binding sensor domain-containing protein